MSSVSSFRPGSENDAPSVAQQAAAQAGHDERVSRAFGMGAAYAMVRIFECGCYYIDYHAYEQQMPTRIGAPYSTFTTIHDFLRGPCIKSKCADIECPDWWYSEEGKNKYGLKDVEDCGEIIRELEEWEERINQNVADYDALYNPVKEYLHGITYRDHLEKMAWVLICPPMWQDQMIIEWCPELRDVREWKRRAIDMAFVGAPRLHYEFCIDAAWESLVAVRSKVRSELELTMEELQNYQNYMVENIGIPQEPEQLPSPSSAVSPGTIPTEKTSTDTEAKKSVLTSQRFLSKEDKAPSNSESYTISASSSRSRRSPLSTDVVSILSPGSESDVEYVEPTQPKPLIYSEPQAVAGASNPSDVDYFGQAPFRNDYSRTSVLVVEAPEESPREPSLSSGPRSGSLAEQALPRRPSTHDFTSDPTTEQWCQVFPSVVTGAKTKKRNEKTPEPLSSGVYSTVYPNISLPSEASAALFDVFASSDTAPPSRVTSLSSSLNSRKRSRNDVEDDEVDNIIALYHPKKRSRKTRPPPLNEAPSYNALKELMGKRIYKVTERDDFEEPSGTDSAQLYSDQIITTTFFVLTATSPDSPLDLDQSSSFISQPSQSVSPGSPMDIDTVSPIVDIDAMARAIQELARPMRTPYPNSVPSTATDSPTLPSIPADPITLSTPHDAPSFKSSRSVATVTTNNPVDKGEVCSKSDGVSNHGSSSKGSRKTKSSKKSWKQSTLRVLKPWRLFQHRGSSRVNRSGSALARAGAELADLRQAVKQRPSVRSKVSASWTKWSWK